MKISLSLLALFAVAFSLSGCDTTANRRSLYSPKKGDGYWTRTLSDGSWQERGSGSTEDAAMRGSAPSVIAPAPIPPPPPAPLPDVPPPAL